MTNGSGAAAGAGIATGIAVGMAIEEEIQESKQRRFSHMGRDQMVIETTDPIEVATEKIAGLYKEWYVKNAEVYEKKDSNYSPEAAIVFGFIAILAVTVWYAIDHWHYPLSAWDTVGLLCGITFISGFLGIFLGDNPIEYIRFSSTDKDLTRILIKIYDSDGRRNLDDDDLLKIKDMLKETGKVVLV